MGPVRPGTKNDCAGEGQQEFRTELSRGAENQSHNLVRVMRQKDMVMEPPGSGTKNDCAAEGQQQFTQNRSRGV
jgi:hypothetical protein